MAEYSRLPQRFDFAGISASPPDSLSGGKLPFGKNIRSYETGTISVRFGLTARSSVSGAVHTIDRLNDPTPFNGGVSAVRIVGAGGSIYRGLPSGSLSLFDTGYSGNPLTTVESQPPQSPRPYLYVGDSAQQRKFTTDGDALQIGLAQPSAPSSAPIPRVGALSTRFAAPGSYVKAGASATSPTSASRINTTVSQIVYDQGSTGYCSIVPVATTGITTGTAVVVGGETTVITDLTIAVASTTVAAILYDSGNTGLCTIQPTGSLGVGQLDAPSFLAYQRRAFIEQGTRFAIPRGTVPGVVDVDADAPVRRIRQMDFPVNCLVVLNGVETVRILSVAVGQDESISFRCSTVTTISAGQTITGLPAFRVYLSTTKTAGATITNTVQTNQIAYPTLSATGTETTTRVTGGINGQVTVNFAQFSDGRAVLPDDQVHVALRVDRLTEVTTVRLFLALTTGSTQFLDNYYYYEWRASDIITAIQGTNAANVTPLVDARKTVVTNQQLQTLATKNSEGNFIQRQAAKIIQRVADANPNGIEVTGGVVSPGGYSSDRSRIIAKQPGDVATTSQLALGNNQWIDLHVRLGDFIRVGTDSSLTLANVKAVQVLVAGAATGKIGTTVQVAQPLTVSYGDIFVAGGSGPDVGDVGDPYVYAYRYRSSETGGISNPSPACRGGVIPQRQSVYLTPVASSDPQVDKIDWFRFGATLTAYTYVGTGPNSTAAFEDKIPDTGLDGAERLRYDMFQPWPTQDLPHTGTCTVAGTAILRTGGDAFDTAWAAGSDIIVNGRVATLYASPASTSLLHVNENLPHGTGLAFTVPGATKLSQPLQAFWGDVQGVYFGCGDPDNPGTLYWTHGNNPEAARDSDTLLVSPPSEPLQNGGVYNTFAFVASSEQVYQILPNNDGVSRYRAIRTPCGRGFWTPWAWCVGPEGIWFLAPDGIFLTAGGSPALSVTDADLRAIFPNDGVPGTSVNGIPAPDMSQTTRLRLSYIAGRLYFDYAAIGGGDYTLILDIAAKAWSLDTSALTGITTRTQEPGDGVFDQILGGLNGGLYSYDESVMSDDGTAIAYAISTPLNDMGQPRVRKLFGDLMVSIDTQDADGGVQIGVQANNGFDFIAPVTVGVDINGRLDYVVGLNGADGLLATNLGIEITGSVTAADTGRPVFYLWEPAFIPKSDNILQRASDWELLGYGGAKFVQGLILTANTFGVDKEIVIQKDGGATAITLTINHDGEVTKAYPLAVQSPPGWTPFVTHMVRIAGTDEVAWQLLGYQFVWEPAPELATQWETQFTSHDAGGYLTIRDAVIAHESTCPIRLRVTYDDGPENDYVIPASGGVYKRDYVVLVGRKGIAVKYQLRSSAPFRIYKRDCSIRALPWGSAEPYRQTEPFGGPHRESGARI